MSRDLTRPVRSVFAIGRGQYENVGDLVLRRQLLEWVATAEDLHVYVGRSPDGYDEGLQLPAGATTHRSLASWYAAGLRAALRGPVGYLFKPGELQLTLVGMKEHLVVLPLLAAVRLRGGRAVRAGVGSRNFAPLPRLLMRPSIALSDLTLWRDVRSAEYFGTGELAPDLAFGEGASDDVVEAARTRTEERNALVVSLRTDLVPPPYPGAGWIEGVRRYAAEEGLEIWAVTQVQVDDERTVQLAADLGGKALTWPETADHWGQEQRLRALYRRTAVALSDRLHVVIAAHTEGAVPFGSLTDSSDKLERHFAAIGLHGVSHDVRGWSADQVVAALRAAEAGRAEACEKLLAARVQLRQRRDQVRRLFGLARSGVEDQQPLEAVPGVA